MMGNTPDVIDVFPFSIEDDSSITVGKASEFLSADEAERAASFRFSVHRDRYVRGRGKMRSVLSQYLDEDPKTLPLKIDALGKPFLEDFRIHFNLSHSEDLAVLAVSEIPSIGIDIEQFSREVDIEGLGRRCFTEKENERIEKLAAEEKVRAFFWTWTAKEARMKATGEGFRLEPKRIEIAFSGEYPEKCLAPREPSAYVKGVDLPKFEAACTVAALRPFSIELREA